MPRIRRPAPDKVKATLESLLFVAQEPVELAVLARSLHLKEEEVEEALDSLAEDCHQRGVRIQRSGDLVQMVTAPESARYVENFLNMDHHQRLSTAGLETLAIIAYRQPITRAGIEAVRGVNSDGAVATLLARELIEEVGTGAHARAGPCSSAPPSASWSTSAWRGPEDLPPLPEDDARRGKTSHDRRSLSRHAAPAGERVAQGEAAGRQVADGAHPQPLQRLDRRDRQPGELADRLAGH